MGQPADEWPLSGGAIGARAPAGPPISPFSIPAAPVNPPAEIPWGEIANPTLPGVSILLPALNEEEGIAAVLNRIARLTPQQKGFAYSVHLLDGGSTDRTRIVLVRDPDLRRLQRDVGLRFRSAQIPWPDRHRVRPGGGPVRGMRPEGHPDHRGSDSIRPTYRTSQAPLA